MPKSTQTTPILVGSRFEMAGPVVTGSQKAGTTETSGRFANRPSPFAGPVHTVHSGSATTGFVRYSPLAPPLWLDVPSRGRAAFAGMTVFAMVSPSDREQRLRPAMSF